MRNNEIEKKLSAEIEARTPNNYKKVLSVLDKISNIIIDMMGKE